MAILLGLAGAGAANGQVHGTVVNVDERPVAGVEVVMFGTGEVLGSGTTDARGGFTIPQSILTNLRRISLHHLRFETAIVHRDEIVEGLVVRLTEEPVEVEGLLITAEENRCPQPDEPEARSMWERASGRYSHETPGRGVAVRGTRMFDQVDQAHLFEGLSDDLPYLDSPHTRRSDGRPSRLGRYPFSESVVIASGYGWEPIVRGGRHLNWAYPSLDLWSAHHFAAPVFGELHDFHVVTKREDRVEIGFCPGEPSTFDVRIAGTLVLDEDGELLEGQWSFLVPDQEEFAGGWVSFTRASDPVAGAVHLAAQKGMFYRQIPASADGGETWYIRDRHQWLNWWISADSRTPVVDDRLDNR